MDIKQIRQDFPMLTVSMQSHPLIYFDNAATSLKPRAVIDTVTRYYESEGASVHRGDFDLSYQVSNAYEKTRELAAQFLNAASKEIVFTAGASASLNLVAYGYGEKFLKAGDVILSSEAEHASCILPWMKCAEAVGAVMEYIPLDSEGRITIENFKKCINAKVKVVALAHISNVLGFAIPLKEICAIAHQFGAVVVVDGAQSVPHMPVDVKDLDCDFLAFSSHKMIGPSGLGVLYGKFDLLESMSPSMLGGGSNARFDICGNLQLKNAPFKFESGTPAIEATLGFGAALQYLTSIGMQEIHRYEMELHDYAIAKLKALPNIKLHNPRADCGIITFNVEGVFAQDASTYFNSRGIATRAGQHCAKILMHFLQEAATVRASLYFYNTKEEIDCFVEVCRTANPTTCMNVYF